MRKYFIGAREVTKEDWKETYKRLPEASVIIRTDKLPSLYNPPTVDAIITPDRAREIRLNTKLLS